jgi:hypothetical protein
MGDYEFFGERSSPDPSFVLRQIGAHTAISAWICSAFAWVTECGQPALGAMDRRGPGDYSNVRRRGAVSTLALPDDGRLLGAERLSRNSYPCSRTVNCLPAFSSMLAVESRAGGTPSTPHLRRAFSDARLFHALAIWSRIGPLLGRGSPQARRRTPRRWVFYCRADAPGTALVAHTLSAGRE